MENCQNEDECLTPMWCRGRDKCQKQVESDKANGPLDAAACSAAVPFGKRGPMEIHTGEVLMRVHAQQEPDGTWVAMVPDLTQRCQSAATREEAIRMACEAVSVRLPNTKISNG